jgi:hypothetical protein
MLPFLNFIKDYLLAPWGKVLGVSIWVSREFRAFERFQKLRRIDNGRGVRRGN